MCFDPPPPTCGFYNADASASATAFGSSPRESRRGNRFEGGGSIFTLPQPANERGPREFIGVDVLGAASPSADYLSGGGGAMGGGERRPSKMDMEEGGAPPNSSFARGSSLAGSLCASKNGSLCGSPVAMASRDIHQNLRLGPPTAGLTSMLPPSILLSGGATDAAMRPAPLDGHGRGAAAAMRLVGGAPAPPTVFGSSAAPSPSILAAPLLSGGGYGQLGHQLGGAVSSPFGHVS